MSVLLCVIAFTIHSTYPILLIDKIFHQEISSFFNQILMCVVAYVVCV